MAIDEDLIEHYMNLGKKIDRAKERMTYQRELFYSQTLSSYITTDGIKVYSKGFSIENNVARLVDTEAESKKYIERLEFQYKHFISFFNGLPYTTQTALKSKYWHRQPVTIEITEKVCMDEINEIEEACRYRFERFDMQELDTREKELSFHLFEMENEADSFEKMIDYLGI